MKKNVTIYDGVARYVTLSDGVAQLKIEVNSKAIMMTDGQEVNKPQSTPMNALLELPLYGKALTVAIAREISVMKIGHRLSLTVTEYGNGRKNYDICNISMCNCL